MELWCCSAQHAAQQQGRRWSCGAVQLSTPHSSTPHQPHSSHTESAWCGLCCTVPLTRRVVASAAALCNCSPPILQMEGGRMLYDAQCYESRPQHAVPACKKNMIAWLMHCC